MVHQNGNETVQVCVFKNPLSFNSPLMANRNLYSPLSVSLFTTTATTKAWYTKTTHLQQKRT